MQSITTDTLLHFRPTYEESFDHRLENTVERIGVDSPRPEKDFFTEMEILNRESAIGFNEAECKIIALIQTADQANTRFNGTVYIHPDDRGNTAEHPHFLCHQIDAVRSAAGYGPAAIAHHDTPHQLAAARLSQALHQRSLLHDIGESIDIDYSEQLALGASKKEPDEEAAFGQFKLTLAAFALSMGTPELYIETIHGIRARLLEKKNALYAKASAEIAALPERGGEAQRQIGDRFITDFGKTITQEIAAATQHITHQYGAMQDHYLPAYQEAAETLGRLATSHEQRLLDDQIFLIMDKFEGNAHFRHFAGRTERATKQHTLMERLYPDNQCVSYHLSPAASVKGYIESGQKACIQAFAEVTAQRRHARTPADHVRLDVAQAFVRAASIRTLSDYIRLLQKAPPMLDLTQQSYPLTTIPQTDEARETLFAQQLMQQRAAKNTWLGQRRACGSAAFPLTELSGVIDNKALIAVMDKACRAIESGWVPTAMDMPIGFKPLPPELQVTYAEYLESCRHHKLDAAQEHYKQAGVRL